MRKILKIDVKNEYVVKGRQLEGVRKFCKIDDLSLFIPENDFEEILVIDYTKSNFGLDPNYEAISSISNQYNLPITYGGGLSNYEQILKAADLGASRFYFNTAMGEESSIELLKKIGENIGRQSIVVGIEYRRLGLAVSCFYSAGRDLINTSFGDYLLKLSMSPISELILTSIDRDGMLRGIDKEICQNIKLNVPIILAGGYDGNPDNLDTHSDVSGIAASTYYLNSYNVKI